MMVDSAMQKLPLACGTCRLHEPKSRKNRLSPRLFEGEDSNTIRLPWIVLIQTRTNSDDVEQQQWILCRYVGRRPCSCHRDNSLSILCFDNSIEVITDGLFELGSFLEKKYPAHYCRHIGNSRSRTQMEDEGSRASSEHFHLQLHSLSKGSASSLESSSDYPSSFVVTLRSVPVFPALSVSVIASVSVDSSTTTKALIDEGAAQQPLLQSALKRQLVGMPIVFDDGEVSITTRICLPFLQKKWNLIVESVLAEKQEESHLIGRQQKLSLYLIMPSTRITLIMGNSTNGNNLITEEADSAVAKFPSSASPAAKLLVDTITCIRRRKTKRIEDVSASLNVNVPRAFLFTGPPGVGKSHAVRVAVECCNYSPNLSCHLISLQGAEIMAEGPEAARLLERHFQKAVHAKQPNSNDVSMIFLDECEALLSADNVAAMLAYLLDKVSSDNNWKHVVVVAATNRIESVPAFLRRPGRFDKEIPLSPPNARERSKILTALLRDNSKDEELQINEKELLEIAESCVGYVPADLELLVRKTMLLQATAATSDGKSSLYTFLKRSMSNTGASALRDAILAAPPKTGWSDIAGDPGGSKTALQQAIEWPRTKSEAYKRLGLSAPRGILLHGPPGCAKTSLARAAAGASGVAFLSLSPADVFSSSYVGDSEAVVRRAFTLARSASPCVLFFDELDSIIGADGATGHHHCGMSRGHTAEARVLSTFLNEMDGVDGSWKDGVLVLAATNRPWTIDAALLRPGRFDKIIYVPPPDAEGRRSILEMQCRQWQTDKPLDLDYLSSDALTANMTGAEIVGACRAAAMHTIRESINDRGNGRDEEPVLLKQDTLEDALRNVQPLLSKPQVMREYMSFEERRLQS